jgi:hypothetical protein
MSDPDNFLTRWSRRKRENEAKSTEADSAGSEHAALESADQKSATSAKAVPAEPEFDVSKLPPIESIGAETDISAFMQKGVPSALRHAALRRVWAADPAIRNYVGINENFWDAAGPDGIPGFGELDPNLDVKRLVAELFGERPAEEAKSDSASDSAEREKKSADPGHDESSGAAGRPLSAEDSLVQRTENAAPQKDSESPPPEKKLARRHGGAMPE